MEANPQMQTRNDLKTKHITYFWISMKLTIWIPSIGNKIVYIIIQPNVVENNVYN
jgi:hypothetical protein